MARASRALRLGIGDDCAILRPGPGYEICVTTDFTLEERHFRARVASAGVGGTPMPGARAERSGCDGGRAAGGFSFAGDSGAIAGARGWSDFCEGFLALGERYRVALAGGDTAESPADSRCGLIVADVVAVGQAREEKLCCVPTRDRGI